LVLTRGCIQLAVMGFYFSGAAKVMSKRMLMTVASSGRIDQPA